MKHWIYYISSIEYTTYEALGGQWGWFCKSGSYFALFENFDGALGKFKKNDTGFAYNGNFNIFSESMLKSYNRIFSYYELLNFILFDSSFTLLINLRIFEIYSRWILQNLASHSKIYFALLNPISKTLDKERCRSFVENRVRSQSCRLLSKMLSRWMSRWMSR